MNYKKAYLTMFNRLTDLIAQLETLDSDKEQMNIVQCLKMIQTDGESCCIDDIKA